MDSINETSAKRRKLNEGQSPKPYDSQEDSGDDIFNTITTEILPRRAEDSNWETTQNVTQPTQIIGSGNLQASGSTIRPPPIVQVAGSSPLRYSQVASPSPALQRQAPLISSLMAPAGTTFRAPPGIVKTPLAPTSSKPKVIDLSDDDDGPAYRGGSSEEESQLLKADIRPSSFVTQAPKTIGSLDDRFKQITSKPRYGPDHVDGQWATTVLTRSSDVMANAYSAVRRNQSNHLQQTGPAKAQSVVKASASDVPLDSIPDFQIRTNTRKILSVLPTKTVLECKAALENHRNNYTDALAYLVDQEDKSSPIDLTSDDDTQSAIKPGQPLLLPNKTAAKQQIKAPIRRIHEKWTSTQRTSQASPLSPVPVTPPKPRRRLIQGRKRALSPVVEPSPMPRSCVVASRCITPESVDSDSGFDEVLYEAGIESRLLAFFNTCSSVDLTDIAAITEEIASTILEKKPFSSLDDIRQITQKEAKHVKIRKPKLLGDKIVDKCLDIWAGYEAVDELVQRCKDVSKPLIQAMAKWGVDVYGSASKDGELEIVDVEIISNSTRDSGIGTPSSRSISVDADGDSDISKPVAARRQDYFGQPSNMSNNVVLKDYQIVGINWLTLIFDQGLSGILADDMGLGKTCQVVGFLAHLLQKGIKGPHLIVVPASTLENWLREFRHFCPLLEVVPYYGTQEERSVIREQIEQNHDNINVIVTTYNIASKKDDNKFFRRLKAVCCIYDEGHMLRNSKAAGYGSYMRINAQFRLLLTGTPLQNNLRELVSLLGFILPSVFKEHSEDLEAIFNHKAKTTDENESHAALLSAQRIARAKSMMSPFVLRRKKHQVLKQLPRKDRRIELCDMMQSQLDIYEQERERVRQILQRRHAGEAAGNENTNIMMSLRQAAIHPLLFRRHYDDKILKKMAEACLKEDTFRESNVDLVLEDMTVMNDIELYQFCEQYPATMSSFQLLNEPWMDSGKVKALSALLQNYKRNGDRVLVFSQFVMVMNILELVMETLAMRFFRLDGQTKIEERQLMIDEFYEDPEITVFLLSTKAGGAGINLACANKVIIFDSSFNPQDDIQAENRAHRVGQLRDVEVVRLVSQGTIEEQIRTLGETKLALDERVSGVSERIHNKKDESRVKNMVEEMMISNIEKEMETGTRIK